MFVRMTKNASVCKRCLPILAKVQTTLGTKHLVTEGVRTIEEIHSNMENQDTKFEFLLGVMKIAKYGTDDLGGNSKEGR